MVRHKRGWIRILEAVLAIMLIAGVALVVYTNQGQKEDISDYVYRLQAQVLSDISYKSELRNAVFNQDLSVLNAFAKEKIPDNFNFSINICNVNDPCKLDFYTDKDVYANDVILGTNADFTSSSPKKVRLFIWER